MLLNRQIPLSLSLSHISPQPPQPRVFCLGGRRLLLPPGSSLSLHPSSLLPTIYPCDLSPSPFGLDPTVAAGLAATSMPNGVSVRRPTLPVSLLEDLGFGLTASGCATSRRSGLVATGGGGSGASRQRSSSDWCSL